MSNRKEYISHDTYETVIKCDECNMEFILTGVIRGEEGNITWAQGTAKFCPFCGCKNCGEKEE